MESLEQVPAAARTPSYHSMAGLSYTELRSSLHPAYHPIPSSYLNGSIRGKQQQFHGLSSAGGAPIVTCDTNGVDAMQLSGYQWINESNVNAGSSGSSTANKKETPPGTASQEREQSTSADAAATKDLTELRSFQHSQAQNRLMMQTQPAINRDRYSFDPRWMDPKLLQGGEWFKISTDSNAADTLLSMKRAAVVHLNTAVVKADTSLQLRGWDGYRAPMIQELCYEDYGEEKPGIEQAMDKEYLLRRGGEMLASDGRDKHNSRDTFHPWHWRHQEVNRKISSDESYEPQPLVSQPAAKESTSEPDDFRLMGHHIMEGYQSSGYVNSKTLSSHYNYNADGSSGANNSDVMTNTRYYTRSNENSLPSDFASARWNVNASSSIPKQQPYVAMGGTPVKNRALNAGGLVSVEMGREGSVAQAHQKQNCNNNNNHAAQNHRCHICGKSCTRPSSLKTHIRCHYGEKPYLCQICGKNFSQAANLTAHMRIHSGEKPFKCVVCNRNFSQSSSVKTHMRTHTGERPYPCTFCSKSFSDSSTLSNHRRTHTGEKPYQCRVCCRPFSQSGNLNRHMRIHQKGGQPAARGRASCAT